MAIEQIERDIAAIEVALGAIAAELRSAYASYLTILGQAMRQQLILASYHLCTQGYPQPFLSLPFSQRQQLQQNIRKLGQQAAERLLAVLSSTGEVATDVVTDETDETDELSVSLIDDSSVAPAAKSAANTPPSNPKALAEWQQQLERAIVYTLKTVSRDVNRLFQQAEILPTKLPEQLLEAAATSSEGAASAAAGPPNLLNLLIEAQHNERESESTMTQIIAIHLRLAEIEFADTTVRAGRNQIRNLLAKASSLGREYHKKQRERAVAEAEAAWRASWFD